MGDSGQACPTSGPGSYRFVEHRRYLDALLDELGVTENVTFVVHDWGSALGFDWANRHRERGQGNRLHGGDRPPGRMGASGRRRPPPIFRAMRSEAGEEIVLDKNVFVERILPASVLRQSHRRRDGGVSPAVTSSRASRAARHSTWPREIPIDGEPADVVEIVAAYGEWLAQTEVPKLFVNADPGSILTGPQREFCRTGRIRPR